MIDFVTSYFFAAHGKNPRGPGSWAFGAEKNTKLSEIFWAPYGTYSQAKVAASKWAREKGISVVYVQS